jgi:hypothetical protein
VKMVRLLNHGMRSMCRGEIMTLLIIAILCYYNSFGTITRLKDNNSLTGKDELKQTQSKSFPNSSSSLLEMIPSLPTSTSSPPLLRISHQLHFVDQLHNENPFNPYLTCRGRFLHPEMEAATGVLDFSTSIRTNLKILLMGDSVGIQFSQTLEMAMGADPCARKVLRYTSGKEGFGHEGLHVSAPIQGGGTIAGWRINGILQRDGENKTGPNKCCGGWSREDSHKLLRHNYTTTTVGKKATTTIGSFDVLIFRIPHGWFALDLVTEEKLQEMIKIASEVFGVKTVMIISLPYINNVKTLGGIRQLKDTNNMIHKLSHNWPLEGKHGVDHVQVLDFATFGDSMMEWNANLMGMDTSSANYTLKSLKSLKTTKKKHQKPRSIAQVCAKCVPDQSTECEPSGFSLDGMHWCMERMGGRFVASTSCLLGCIYNQNNTSNESSNSTTIKACERSCNDQFMSLKSVLHDNAAGKGSHPLPLVKSNISSATSNKCFLYT